MQSWRVLEAVGCLLVAGSCSWAQSGVLAESVQPGDCFHVQLDMKLTGEMRIQNEGSALPLKLEATGTHEFRERVLQAKANLIEKSARVYEKAQAVIRVGQDRVEKSLRPDRSLVVAQRQRDQNLVYSPKGPLTRHELDVVSDHFDLLTVAGLLPGKAVAVGDTWKIPNGVVQGVCNLEGVTEHSLQGKLEALSTETATFTVSGTVNGIDMGALVKMTIDARGQFDLKAKRLTALEWSQKDDRDQGPVSPLTRVETKITLKRRPIDQPECLSDPALVAVPDKEPLPQMLNLEARDPKGRFELLHGREWMTVSQGEERLIMRLMERGEFIAQVTITPWTKAEKGKHMEPKEFKQMINGTPGWEVGQELQAGEVPDTSDGRWVYRLSELGTLDGLNVLQNFYLAAGPEGDQVVVAFTMTPKQGEKLGSRDLSLVGSLELPRAAKKDATK